MVHERVANSTMYHFCFRKESSMAELEPMSAEKQQAYYDLLKDAVGESLAYFYACIRFNKPFDMNALPGGGAKNKWSAYCEKLTKKKLDRTPGGGELGFLDGLTDVTKIFGEGWTAAPSRDP